MSIGSDNTEDDNSSVESKSEESSVESESDDYDNEDLNSEKFKQCCFADNEAKINMDRKEMKLDITKRQHVYN